MIVELVDKLIDRCIQLIKHHQETRRNLLEDFVNPVFSEFESVHENYLECFQKYQDIIKSSDNPRSVIHEIDKDHLFTEGQRRKLIEFSDFSEEPMVGGFVDAIRCYLIGTERSVNQNNTPRIGLLQGIFGSKYKANLPRMGLLQELNRVYSTYIGYHKREEIQRMKALYALDSSVEEMQSRYIIVTSEYIKLKKKLLM